MSTQHKVTIDRQLPVPLHQRLAERLSLAIAVGQLQSGYPFEKELAGAERRRVPRRTVRVSALDLPGDTSLGYIGRPRRGLNTADRSDANWLPPMYGGLSREVLEVNGLYAASGVAA